MKRAYFLVLLVGAACDGASVAGQPDAAPPTFTFDATAATPPDASPPDFVCLNHPPPTTAVDPLALAGTVETITGNGAVVPVDAAALALFRTGQPVVLARTQTDATGAFSAAGIPSGGHPLAAYLKATKPGFRTTFLYPPFPLTKSAMAIPLPMLSDAMFATITSSLGTTQDDRTNGALLVAVADCKAQLVPGAALTVTRGNSHTSAGRIYDLGSIVPGAAGLFLVLDVPDGKVHVSASYNGNALPEHDVFVRAQDPDCKSARSTLTATAVVPAA